MRLAFVLPLIALACGPSEQEVQEAALAEAKRACGRSYSSTEKVLKDMLYSQGLAEVKLIEKEKYADACAAMKLTKEQLRCFDPNLNSDAACQDPEIKKKVGELTALMISPMKSGGAAEGAAAGGAAPAAPADGTATPAAPQ
jgi:hypothetical protein